jgi:vancomycin resistance protein VanJ
VPLSRFMRRKLKAGKPGRYAGKRPAPKRRAWPLRACAASSAVYAVIVGAIWYCNVSGPEQWRWVALNLYFPQWLWLIPGAVLLPATLIVAWRWSWMAVLPMLVVAGPLMDFHWSSGSADPPPGATRVRVMSYNVDQRLAGALVGSEILAADPDVVILQEANSRPWSDVTEAALGGYRLYGPFDSLLIACRLPVRRFETLHIPMVQGVDVMLRCRAVVDGREVSFYATHLPTPRWGIAPLIARGVAATQTWQQTINARLWTVVMVSDAIDKDAGPRIVGGDFNAPQASQVTARMMRRGLADAFVAAGRGYGWTYGHELGVRHSYVRIDHILASHDWIVEQCKVGGAEASDHRPVIADLYLGSSR